MEEADSGRKSTVEMNQATLCPLSGKTKEARLGGGDLLEHRADAAIEMRRQINAEEEHHAKDQGCP